VGSRGDFFKKGVGDPNPFTVSQMPFFRSVISKVCRKNKVSQGISKKSPWPPEAYFNKKNFVKILGKIFFVKKEKRKGQAK
jgi:hypothetical protein